MDIQGFLYVLPYIGKGMLGIFIVTAVVIAMIELLNRVSSGKKRAEQ